MKAQKYGKTSIFGGIAGKEKVQRYTQPNENGRFPANTILTYNETDKEEVCGGFPVENNGSASRYFYCAKASAKDRDEGLGYLEKKTNGKFSGQK